MVFCWHLFCQGRAGGRSAQQSSPPEHWIGEVKSIFFKEAILLVNRLKTKCITKLDVNKNLTRSLPLEHRPGAGTRSSLCDRAAGE